MIYLDGKELIDHHIGDKETNRVLYGSKLVWDSNRLIDLGVGRTFDVASVYADYGNLTADNFFVIEQDPETISGTCYGIVHDSNYYTYLTMTANMVKTYDASTGQLQFYLVDKFCTTSTTSETTVVSKYADFHVVLATKPEKLVYLGNATTFNIKSMFPDEYQNLTADNFLASKWDFFNGGMFGYLLHAPVHEAGTWSGSGQTTFIKEYNANTGILLFETNNTAQGGGEYVQGDTGYYVYFSKRKAQ